MPSEKLNFNVNVGYVQQEQALPYFEKAASDPLYQTPARPPSREPSTQPNPPKAPKPPPTRQDSWKFDAGF